jgi:hypothetical protein
MRDTDYRINTYKRGRQCLRDLGKDKNWIYWSGVIDALAEARTEAFEVAGTNRPVGSAYNRAFGEIIAREKLDSTVLDSATRNHCLQIAENRAAVEAWRATLTQNLRQTLNHPGSLYKRWKKATTVPEPREPKPSVRDSVVELEEKLGAARRHIEELEASRDTGPDEASSNPFDTITQLIAQSRRFAGGGHVFSAIETPPSFRAKDIAELVHWLQHLEKATNDRQRKQKRQAKEAKASQSGFKVGDAVVWRRAKTPGSNRTPIGVAGKIVSFGEKDGKPFAILTQGLDCSDIGIAGSDATNEWAASLEDIHRE